jgi:hypothetical protein
MPEPSNEHQEFIENALKKHPNSKIAVIKMVREEFGLGLKEAKEMVDSISSEHSDDSDYGYEGRKKGCLGLIALFLSPIGYAVGEALNLI